MPTDSHMQRRWLLSWALERGQGSAAKSRWGGQGPQHAESRRQDPLLTSVMLSVMGRLGFLCMICGVSWGVGR